MTRKLFKVLFRFITYGCGMSTVIKSGFAEFVFPTSGSRGVSGSKVDLVNPAVVGFSEDEFSLVMVDTSGDNPSYVGITHSGGYVVLSPRSGERQLLQLTGSVCSIDEIDSIYKMALNGRYAQVRMLSILVLLSIISTVAALYVIWPVIKVFFAQSHLSIASVLAAFLCAFLVVFSVRILYKSIRSIVLN